MRVIPVLALLFLLNPNSLNAGPNDKRNGHALDLALCKQQIGIVQKAFRAGDFNGLKGLLLPGGVAIGSPDGSVSKAEILQAGEAWNRVLGERVFRIGDANEAIRVTVKKVSGIGESGDTQGLADFDEAGDGSVLTRILVDGQIDGRPLDDREVGAVITHELGHLLGLDDIPDGGGVMGEFDPHHVNVRPSKAEVAAVLALREATYRAIRSLPRQ